MLTILITVKPQYLVDILNGKKKFEFRGFTFNEDFKVLVVCGKGKYTIVKRFYDRDYIIIEAEKTIIKVPSVLYGKVCCSWIVRKSTDTKYISFAEGEYYLKNGCLSLEDWQNYQRNKKHCYAWEIEDLEIFDEPKTLESMGVKRPPQNFIYLERGKK